MERKAIICIDDESIILNSLVEQLENHYGSGYIYEGAESAEEAYDLIDDLTEEDIEIEIIVCDWLMPGLKGDEFLLKIDLKYPHVTKILLTGQADENSVKNLQHEADKFAVVHKPWDKEDLFSTIKKRMNNE